MVLGLYLLIHLSNFKRVRVSKSHAHIQNILTSVIFYLPKKRRLTSIANPGQAYSIQTLKWMQTFSQFSNNCDMDPLKKNG